MVIGNPAVSGVHQCTFTVTLTTVNWVLSC